MSNHKQHRASVNRLMRSYKYSDNPIRQVIAVQNKRVPVEKNPYKETLAHIRVSTKLGSRINIALGLEGDRMSKRAREFIERYELYALHARHTKETCYDVHTYIRQYHRKDPTMTYNIRQEIKAWYNEHGTERIQRMRKQHAIVGTDKRVILRTA